MNALDDPKDYLLPRLATPSCAIPLTDSQQQILDEIREAGWNWVPNPCLCGRGEESRPIAGTGRYGLPLQTVLCAACGLVRSDPYPDATALEWFYRDRYRRLYMPQYDPDAIWAEQLERGRRIVRRVASTIALPERVYEIGCSAGGILSFFRDHGASVVGCDYDVDSLAYARVKGVEVVEGPFTCLPDDPVPELIVLSHVLEHLVDPVTMFESIRSSPLRTSRIYLEVPGLKMYRSVYRLPETFFHIGHVWHFTLETLDRLMSRVGYRRLGGSEMVWAVYEPSEPADMPPRREHATEATQVLTHAERFRTFPSRNRIWREILTRIGCQTDY